MADIFGDDTITPDDNELDVTIETLVGDGQKYKDANELAKAYTHADRALAERAKRIAELEASDKVLRDLLEARGTKAPAEEQKTEVRKEDNPEPKPDLKSEDISELVRKELNTASQEQKKAANINRAAEELNKFYGSASKSQEAIRNKAAELGVGFEWLKDMAATSPDAFLASMGLTPEARRSISTPGFSNEVNRDLTGGRKNMAYFEEIRKKNPKAYYSSEVQKQLFAARRELGDKFFT